jgi:hypothetical protein
MLSLDELIHEISKKSEQTEDEVKKMIEEKQDELSGLVSEEGAAYIVARELGLSFLEEESRNLKTKDVAPGMFSVDLKCKIAKINELRTFDKNGVQGAVQNILLGDETGVIRMSIWNEEIEKFKEMGIREGDTVKLSNVMSKGDNLGKPELRLGKKGNMEKIDDEGIMLPASVKTASADMWGKEKTIDELRVGDRARIKGTIIQLFKRKPYYEVCEKCDGRLEKLNDKMLCKKCGETSPKFVMLVSGIIDDGYGNIRFVLFRESAEQLIGKTANQLEKMVAKGSDPLTIFDDLNVVGKRIGLGGSVKENSFTKSVEFMASEIHEIDAGSQSKDIVRNLDNIKRLD